jgi:hypothetical protein
MQRLASLLPSALAFLALLGTSRSARAQPTKDQCVEANEKAQELRRRGNLIEARALLALCTAASCPGVIREDCAQRLSEVEDMMPTIVFEVRDALGREIAAVSVMMDGKPLVDRLNGIAIAVDPGEHEFVFGVEGRNIDRSFVLHERDKARHEVIQLEGGLTPPPPWGTTPPASTARIGARTGEAEGGSPWTFISAGLGVAGLAAGIVGGLAATSKHTTLEGECMGNACPASAQGDIDSFHTLKTVSMIGYVVGAVGLVGAGVLYFTVPASRKSATPGRAGLWVSPTSAGIGGVF